MQINLEAKPPFSLASVIKSYGWIQLAPFSMLSGEARLTYVDQLHSGKVVKLVIQEAPNGVTVDTGVSINLEEQEEITEKVISMLGLDLDFSDFYKLIANEPRLASVRTFARGCVLRSPTLFEDTVKTILTTNTVWGSTREWLKDWGRNLDRTCLQIQYCRLFRHPDRLPAVIPQFCVR